MTGRDGCNAPGNDFSCNFFGIFGQIPFRRSGDLTHNMWWVVIPKEPIDHKRLEDYSTVVTPVSMTNS